LGFEVNCDLGEPARNPTRSPCRVILRQPAKAGGFLAKVRGFVDFVHGVPRRSHHLRSKQVLKLIVKPGGIVVVCNCDGDHSHTLRTDGGIACPRLGPLVTGNPALLSVRVDTHHHNIALARQREKIDSPCAHRFAPPHPLRSGNRREHTASGHAVDVPNVTSDPNFWLAGALMERMSCDWTSLPDGPPTLIVFDTIGELAAHGRGITGGDLVCQGMFAASLPALITECASDARGGRHEAADMSGRPGAVHDVPDHGAGNGPRLPAQAERPLLVRL
jgi:hypothetical protein